MMAKKKPSPKIWQNTGFWIFASVVFIYLFYPSIFSGLITIILQGLNLYDPTQFGDPTGDLPTAYDSCQDYSIIDEFTDYFGASNIQAFNDGCTAFGGRYTGTDNEVSCHFPATVNIDCNNAGLAQVHYFCNYLQATYLCSNTTKYLGCYCTGTPPVEPLEDDDGNGDDEVPDDTYTCGWKEQTALNLVCEGTCPPDKECVVFQETCDCFSPDEFGAGVGTIFASSTKWNGAFGGLAGGDAKCQQLADFAGLNGQWIILASDDTTDAKDRLPDVVYTNMGGLIVANNRADLFDGAIANFINFDENGNALGADEVWTGTDVSGNSYSGGDLTLNCHNWGWTSEGYFGVVGNTGSNGVGWIENTVVKECIKNARIYCARVS